jgi:hypothetical protein
MPDKKPPGVRITLNLSASTAELLSALIDPDYGEREWRP